MNTTFGRAVLVTLLVATRSTPAAQVFTTAPPGSAAQIRESITILEQKLESSPADSTIRIQLLREYFSAAPAPAGLSSDERLQARRRHILWIIRNQPHSPVLSEAAGHLTPAGDPQGYAEAKAAWQRHLGGPVLQSSVLRQAVSFFAPTDPAFAAELAERGAKAFPTDRFYTLQQGTLLAGIAGIRGRAGATVDFDAELARSPGAGAARRQLLESSDPFLLGSSVTALSTHYRQVANRDPEGAPQLYTLVEQLAARLREIAGKDSQPAATALATLYTTAAGLLAPNSPKRLALLEKGIANVITDDEMRFAYLGELAEARLVQGDTDQAAADARRWMSMADGAFKTNWNYGNAIHRGNLLLGRMALAAGNVDEAKQRLLAAGRTPGSPQLNSFGPQWELAQALLDRGDRDTVIQYLELCRAFWTGQGPQLDSMAASIRAGNPIRLGRPAALLNGPSPLLNRPAPDFALKELRTGDSRTLAAYQGKVVLLDFWATWCAPCRQEMPVFEQIHREALATNKDLAVVMVNVNEPSVVVSSFIEKEKFTFPVLLTEGKDTTTRYQVSVYPTLVVLDRQGKVIDVVQGSRPEATLRRIAESALAGATTGSATPLSAASPEDYLRIAAGLRARGNLPEAESAASKAIAAKADWVPALLLRAQIRLALKKFADAATDADDVVRINPNQVPALEVRGLADAGLGAHTKAVADFTRALTLRPDEAAFWSHRAASSLELGQTDQALADLNRALERDPAHIPALATRLRLYLLEKQYARARVDAESILRINPGADWARDRLTEIQKLSPAAAPR